MAKATRKSAASSKGDAAKRDTDAAKAPGGFKGSNQSIKAVNKVSARQTAGVKKMSGR